MIDKPIKVFSDTIEPRALEQFYGAMDQPFSVKGALMPDAHFGYSMPIGGVVATEGHVVPAWVGYDIGCGLCAVQLDLKADRIIGDPDLRKEIFESIYDVVPTGFNKHERPMTWGHDMPMTSQMRAIFDEKQGLRQIGTLGGGNHFIEIGHDEDDYIWIIIHSGSRGVGHETAKRYMTEASPNNKASEGHHSLDVNSPTGRDYIADMNFCLKFALANRTRMVERVAFILGKLLERDLEAYTDYKQFINRNHNHVELKDGLWIHRKGATHAEAGMKGVIPGNMRDGSFIVTGKGNPESLWSSSHGAGRVLGRRAAKEKLLMNDFISIMGGVTAKVTTDTIDESPQAYKDIHEVMRLQSDLVSVDHHVKPIINVKA